MRVGKSGFTYKNGETELERLKNKLATIFLAVGNSNCKDPLIDKAKAVLEDISMLIEDLDDLIQKLTPYKEDKQTINE